SSLASASHIVLTDQRGAPFTIDHLRGTPIVVTFISARCTDACPLIDAEIADAAADPRSKARHVRYLSITLDPKHETWIDMARVSSRFHADPSRWILASGAAADVRALMHAFNVLGNARTHTTFVYVVDSLGRTRSAFPASVRLDEQIFGAVR
ncbi:MAG: SCO family protein, partial [Candidatus Eremiobacteraeota bacterium]|nr:SCO family protein [Candidatus Eremiobacteraeota bacterium]